MKKSNKTVNLSKEKKNTSTGEWSDVIWSLIKLIPITMWATAAIYCVIFARECFHIAKNEFKGDSTTETADNANECEHSAEDTVIGMLIECYTHYFINN